jgi:SCP-2 sterol transfer family
MARYLSSEWHEIVCALADSLLVSRPGASAHLGLVVTGGPDGDIRYHQVIVDGRLVAQGLGDYRDSTPAVTLTLVWSDGVALQKGELDVNVALMQGRVKVAGDMGAVLAIVPVTSSAAYAELQSAIALRTEF